MADSAGTEGRPGSGVSDRGTIERMFQSGGARTLDRDTLIAEVQKHVAEALRSGYEYNTTLEESDAFLRKRVLSRIKLVVLYVDLVGSTRMALSIPEDKVATIISTFAQEMARIVTRHEGRVLKFVGDAVIGYFVADADSLRAADNAVACAKSMIEVIRGGINPILGKDDYPALSVKIGMDYGTNIIVRYGADELKSYVDIMGPPMNIAAKIQSMAGPDRILIGQDVYSRLHPRIQKSFERVSWSDAEWSYKSRETGKVYAAYEYVEGRDEGRTGGK